MWPMTACTPPETSLVAVLVAISGLQASSSIKKFHLGTVDAAFFIDLFDNQLGSFQCRQAIGGKIAAVGAGHPILIVPAQEAAGQVAARVKTVRKMNILGVDITRTTSLPD
jgi:hypothetical protein